MDTAVTRLVWERAARRCEYCRLAQDYAPFAKFQIEHIRARQHEGGDEPDNLALACPRCNRHKGPNLAAIDPETDALVPVFNPRLNDWHEHFALDGIEIVGRTAIGRATVRLLHMNDPDRLKVRAALLEAGEIDLR